MRMSPRLFPQSSLTLPTRQFPCYRPLLFRQHHHCPPRMSPIRRIPRNPPPPIHRRQKPPLRPQQWSITIGQNLNPPQLLHSIPFISGTLEHLPQYNRGTFISVGIRTMRFFIYLPVACADRPHQVWREATIPPYTIVDAGSVNGRYEPRMLPMARLLHL
jgi:hypothetical protein